MSEKLFIGWAECDITPDLEKYSHTGTVFIASGILVERKEEVLSAMKKTPFAFLSEQTENGWCVLVFKR